MLVEISQWRQCHLGFAWLAIAQDDQARRWDALGQNLPAQNRGGKSLEPRVKCCEDQFAFACHQR